VCSMRKIFVFVLFLSLSTSCLARETHQKPSVKSGLEVKKIIVGGHEVMVEIAQKEKDRNRGLMYRQKLEEGTGMLFIFDREQILSFWMKNTFIPLSIGFFTKDKVLVNTLDMVPVESEMVQKLPSYRSTKRAKYALEVPKGWFRKKGIKPGQKFEFAQKPSARSK
jgi:uncharacterized membrane protein (UPF0127 family)